MKLLIIFLLFNLVSHMAIAGKREFTREYTYNASETDSKVSARKAAIQQLQSLVIEEVGVQVQSSFKNRETLKGDEFSRHVQANYETFSQALTQTQILKEKWDGETFYLKAKIIVDTDNLMERIQTVYVQVGGGVGSKDQRTVCEVRHDKVIDLLEDVRTEKIKAELLALSKAHSFDRSCNRWQYGILSSFASDLTDYDDYRAHLFYTIKNHESDLMAGELMIETLKYALRIRPLSDREWMVVRDAIYRGKPAATRQLISLMMRHTKSDMTGKSEREIALNNRKQEYKQLDEKMMELTLAGAQLNLSFNEPMSEEEVAFYIILQALESFPDMGREYFFRYYKTLSKSHMQRLATNVIKAYNKKPDPDSYTLLVNYLAMVEIDKKVGPTLFRQVERMRKQPFYHEEYRANDFDMIVKDSKKELAKIISFARTSEKDKQLWMIEYELPSENVCTVLDCAKGLFSKKRMEAEKAADFLIAYGKRAAPAKASVVKKLNRAKALNKVSNDTRLIPKLLIILDNLAAVDEESIELMVWALGDVSKSINEQAMKSLERVGYQSLPVLTELFESQKATPQRRIIDVMGTFKKQKQKTLAFLETVKPSNQYIRFAIEDATQALSN